jgi:hypothetical protein
VKEAIALVGMGRQENNMWLAGELMKLDEPWKFVVI